MAGREPGGENLNRPLVEGARAGALAQAVLNIKTLRMQNREISRATATGIFRSARAYAADGMHLDYFHANLFAMGFGMETLSRATRRETDFEVQPAGNIAEVQFGPGALIDPGLLAFIRFHLDERVQSKRNNRLIVQLRTSLAERGIDQDAERVNLVNALYEEARNTARKSWENPSSLYRMVHELGSVLEARQPMFVAEGTNYKEALQVTGEWLDGEMDVFLNAILPQRE